MRILLAEDESKTRDYLVKGLRELGFVVSPVSDGVAALTELREHAFDAAILDVMLPGRDGWSIVKKARQEEITVPILFLTARDHVEDRVRGFELGGDDYMVKPFAFAELVARLKNLAKRTTADNAAHTTLNVGDLCFDLLRHRVERAGKALRLTPKEHATLLLLARHAGRVLSRTQIAESVWGIRYEAQTNVVDVLMRRLRKKVDIDSLPPLLHTIRGVGYMFDIDDD